MDELEQMIDMHNAKVRDLTRKQYAAELSAEIRKRIISANDVVEYTAHPEVAGYTRAMEEILDIINPKIEEPDPSRVLAAIRLGFSKPRSNLTRVDLPQPVFPTIATY